MKKYIFYFLKIGITLGLIFWIFSKIHFHELGIFFHHLQWPVFLLILMMVILLWILQFSRWKYLIQSNSSHFQPSDLIPSFFAGFAFRLMVPGGHAEWSKVFLLPGKKQGKIVAFAFEKFFQTFLRLLLVSASVPFLFPQYRKAAWGVFALLIVIYILLPFLSKLKRLQETQVNNHILFFRTFLYSAAAFLCMVIPYYLLWNQASSVSFTNAFQISAFLFSATLIPSLSGLGIREGLAIYLLRQNGVSAEYAVASSLFLFFLSDIIPAIFGCFFIYQKRLYLKDLSAAARIPKDILKNLFLKKQKPEAVSE
jgi:hypothetical protein